MRTLCIPKEKIPRQVLDGAGVWRISLAGELSLADVLWIEREEAETNFAFRHLIPYAVFEDGEGRIACYPRHGSEKRLAGFYSCGIGGHIEEGDLGASLADTVRRGLLRELCEEIANFDEGKASLEYAGLISESETEAGLVHLGLLYRAMCAKGYVPAPSRELEGLIWLKKEEALKLKLELWSRLALSAL